MQSDSVAPLAHRSPQNPASEEMPDLEISSDDYARRFHGAVGRYLLSIQEEAVARALQGLRPGDALDVGGAHGQLLDMLRALGWQVTVHGTSPECETNLRHRHFGSPFVRGPLYPLPAADRSFDLVLAVRLLPHVTRWPRLIAEMCRVSRRTVLFDYPRKSFSRQELSAELHSHGFGIERQVKQLLLPIGVHRVGRAALPLRAAEQLCRFSGLTALAGSPVILRAERLSPA